MGIFKKLFSKSDKKTRPDNGPNPSRELNLQFEPIPENGGRFAQQFVNAVKTNERIDLDYSVSTLGFVDMFLQRFSDEGLTVDDFAETIFVVGAYVGEVMVRNNGGVWIRQEDANLPKGVSMTPLVVKLANGNITDPISKAFKRFHNGEIDSIRYFYQVFTQNGR